MLRIKSVHLLLKDGNEASYEGKDGWKRCLSLAEIGVPALILLLQVIFATFSLNRRVNIFVCPPGKGIIWRNENIKDTNVIDHTEIIISHFRFPYKFFKSQQVDFLHKDIIQS